jgi:hypothetical protein
LVVGGGVAIEGAGGIEEALLAGRAPAQRQAPLGGPGPERERRALRPAAEGVVPGVERQPPVRHGAARVGGEHRAEGAAALLPPERVEHGHRLLEARRRVARAGDGEHDPAQLPGVVRMVVLLGGERQGGRAQEQRGEAKGVHGCSVNGGR